MTNPVEKRIKIFQIFQSKKGVVLQEEINNILVAYGHEEASPQEYDLWCRFYYPAVSESPCFYSEIVLEGRGLSWLGRKLKARRQRKILS